MLKTKMELLSNYKLPVIGYNLLVFLHFKFSFLLLRFAFRSNYSLSAFSKQKSKHFRKNKYNPVLLFYHQLGHHEKDRLLKRQVPFTKKRTLNLTKIFFLIFSQKINFANKFIRQFLQFFFLEKSLIFAYFSLLLCFPDLSSSLCPQAPNHHS